MPVILNRRIAIQRIVHQIRVWFSGADAELAILEGASEGPYLD